MQSVVDLRRSAKLSSQPGPALCVYEYVCVECVSCALVHGSPRESCVTSSGPRSVWSGMDIVLSSSDKSRPHHPTSPDRENISHMMIDDDVLTKVKGRTAVPVSSI